MSKWRGCSFTLEGDTFICYQINGKKCISKRGCPDTSMDTNTKTSRAYTETEKTNKQKEI